MCGDAHASASQGAVTRPGDVRSFGAGCVAEGARRPRHGGLRCVRGFVGVQRVSRAISGGPIQRDSLARISSRSGSTRTTPTQFGSSTCTTSASRFGTLHGSIDHRTVWRDGVPALEFSWEGSHDMDSASGRGLATRVGEFLEGRIFIHNGDDSSFKATERPASPVAAARRRRNRAR